MTTALMVIVGELTLQVVPIVLIRAPMASAMIVPGMPFFVLPVALAKQAIPVALAKQAIPVALAKQAIPVAVAKQAIPVASRQIPNPLGSQTSLCTLITKIINIVAELGL